MSASWGDTMREMIFSHLRDLKLPGMLAVYDEVLEEGRRTRCTTDKTLLRLLTAEVTERQTRTRNYRLGQARFPSVKELDSFDFADTPLNEAQIRHLHEGDFLADHGNVLLVGGSGTGKTHLALSLGMALIRYIRKIRKESFTARERMRAFRRLASTPRQASSTEFLRAAGNFIESYIPPSKQNEKMKDILKLRDDRAFKPSESSEELPHAERQHMLQAIKKAIAKLPVLMMAAVLALSLAGTTGNASETDNLGVKAYEQGEYAKAIDYFSKESGNMNLSKAERAYACFGIGNSYYRMNKPGLAALNYRRALELSPYFTEAEYNLQFIERKEGAILPANTTENQWLTYIRHDTLGPISILSGAVMLTFLALLTVTRRHGALLTLLATLSGLVTVAAVMNYIMYPETPESIPADRLLVVTQKTPGRHAADMNSPALITLPESTPLILRAERGSWYYASTFQNTPVWIPRTDAQPL